MYVDNNILTSRIYFTHHLTGMLKIDPFKHTRKHMKMYLCLYINFYLIL